MTKTAEFTTVPCARCDGTGFTIDDKALGQAMRRTRQTVAISLREMAKRMGISASYLSDLELGRRHWNAGIIEEYRQQVVENNS